MKTSTQIDTDTTENGNGVGILQRMGKFSWTLIVVGMLGGPVGTYFMFRQEMTVAIATIQLQITQHDTQIREVQNKINDGLVPRQEHNVRIELQREVDRLREELRIQEENALRRELDDIRARLDQKR